MINKPKSGDLHALLTLVFVAIPVMGFLSFPSHAQAQGCHLDAPGQCSTDIATDLWWNPPGSDIKWQDLGLTGAEPFDPPFSEKMQEHLIKYVYTELIVKKWWTEDFSPALQQWVTQITAADPKNQAVQSAMADAALLIQTERAKQIKAAQAQANFTPDETLNRLTDMSRSLAASEIRGDGTKKTLSALALARELGKKGGPAEGGADADRKARFAMFQNIYCNPENNSSDMPSSCKKTNPARYNKDINYTRTVDAPATLKLDFTDAEATQDEADVQELSNYLYAHDVPRRLTDTILKDEAEKMRFMNLRQLSALRSVARNSYNTIVGMRAMGDTTAATAMNRVLQGLGMTAADADKVLAQGTGRPSYYAQMEILTKKLFQDPNFYVGTITRPANIDRQTAAIQSIGLMQDRDIYQSLERQEMMLSLLLELKTRNEQQAAIAEAANKGKLR